MKKTKTLKMAQVALMVAIVLVMAFTPLGYFRTAGLEITLLMIPVTVGAIVLGPTAGAILGLVFGLTSFAIAPSSTFGATLVNISVAKTFVVCVIARLAAGWVAGLTFKVLDKLNFKYKFEAASLLGPLYNTLFFMSTLVGFFYHTEYIQEMAAFFGAANPITFVVAFVGLQGLVEAIVCFIISGVISKNVYKVVNK